MLRNGDGCNDKDSLKFQKKSENLSRFLWIGNTQKITHKRLIEHEQKLDECLLKEKTRGRKDGDGKQ